MVAIKDRFTLSSQVTICQDADLRGEITIGSGCVFSPKCTVLAMNGPIVFGDGCIVEENVIIVNRRKEPLIIGDNNLFEVGCRVEAAAIGSHCTFEPKSRVPASIALSDSCTVGAGCTLLPSASLADFDVDEHAGDTVASEIETLPERTVVYGAECARRLWSGEGGGQARALHAKHLAYLREMLPKYAKLKAFAPGTATVKGA